MKQTTNVLLNTWVLTIFSKIKIKLSIIHSFIMETMFNRIITMWGTFNVRTLAFQARIDNTYYWRFNNTYLYEISFVLSTIPHYFWLVSSQSFSWKLVLKVGIGIQFLGQIFTDKRGLFIYVSKSSLKTRLIKCLLMFTEYVTLLHERWKRRWRMNDDSSGYREYIGLLTQTTHASKIYQTVTYSIGMWFIKFIFRQSQLIKNPA